MSETIPPEKEEKLDFKQVFPIFVIILIDLLGLTIIIPLLALYAATFGASPAVIGLLGATYPLMQFVGAPLLGSLSDRYGRKPVLIISQIGTFLGFILLGVAGALPLLFLSRALDGLSGANIATAQAAITDSTTEKTRTQGLGLVGAAFGLGFIIGPIIAFTSLILTDENYHVPAFIAAGFSLLSILLTTFWFKETLPAERRGQPLHGVKGHSAAFGNMWQALRMPQVGLLLILLGLQQVAFGGFEQMLSLFTLTRLGINATGNAMVFVLVGILIVMVQGYYIGQWSRRFGERNLIYWGLAALGLGLILTALTPQIPVAWYNRADLQEELSGEGLLAGETPAQDLKVELPNDDKTGWIGLLWILVAMIPAAVGGSVLHPSINSMLTKSVPAEEIGAILGVSSSIFSGANALAPLIGGVIFEGFGGTTLFILGGLLMLILFGVAHQRLFTTQAILATT